MKSITVFTPTYNRAFCLGQLYTSLLMQTNHDFLWLIVDDGSTDNTKDLAAFWIHENKIEIKYIYKENQGMHSAHNAAYAVINTELSVCIDSDDYMPVNAIESIVNRWKISDKNTAGLIGLDAFKDGLIVGDSFPDEIRTSTLYNLHHKYKIKGDKKLVIRTDVVREFPPYPVYFNERLVPLGILYLMIDQKYQWACTNDVYCIIEYLEEGSSRNILKQYQKSPQGFGYARKIEMRYSKSVKYTFTRAMHYISSCLFQKKIDFFSNNPQKTITFIAIPVGIALHLYLLYKLKK